MFVPSFLVRVILRWMAPSPKTWRCTYRVHVVGQFNPTFPLTQFVYVTPTADGGYEHKSNITHDPMIHFTIQALCYFMAECLAIFVFFFVFFLTLRWMGKNKLKAPTLPRIRYMCFDLTRDMYGLKSDPRSGFFF